MLLEGEKRDEAESFRGEQQPCGHQGNRATESETKGRVAMVSKLALSTHLPKTGCLDSSPERQLERSNWSRGW